MSPGLKIPAKKLAAQKFRGQHRDKDENDNTIPYYKQGKTLMFKKSEIDKWLLRTRVKDNTELMEEAQRYCATHPLGGRRR